MRVTVSDALLDESGSKLSKVAATSLVMGVTRGSSDAYFFVVLPPSAEYGLTCKTLCPLSSSVKGCVPFFSLRLGIAHNALCTRSLRRFGSQVARLAISSRVSHSGTSAARRSSPLRGSPPYSGAKSPGWHLVPEWWTAVRWLPVHTRIAAARFEVRGQYPADYLAGTVCR